VSSMLFLRSVPILLFCLFLSSSLIVTAYLSQSKSLITENIKLHTQRISDSLDAEIALTAQTLMNHEKNWGTVRRGSADIEQFLRALKATSPGFTTFAVLNEKGVDIPIDDLEFSANYIRDLVFFKMQDSPVHTTGITSSHDHAMDIWFEFDLPGRSEEKTIIRALYRLTEYQKVVEQVIKSYPETTVVLRAEGPRGHNLNINWLKSDPVNRKARELNATKGFETVDLLGGAHYVFTSGLEKIPAHVVLASLKSEVDGLRLITIVFFLLFNVIGVGFAGFLIAKSGKVQRDFLLSTADSVKKIGLGEEQPILQYSDVIEYQGLSDAVTELFRLQSEGKVQTKVLNKAMYELFACNDSKSAIIKCVELICTQCHAETAWFEPFVADQEFYRQEKRREKSIKGWQWKNHRITDFDYDKARHVQESYPERQTIHYTIKANFEVIGTLKAFYANGVEDLTRLILDSVVSVLEKVLARHDAIKKNVLYSIEQDVADTIQKSVVSSAENNLDSRVAKYFSPSDILGGDWFFIIPNKDKDSCYFIMGKVAGQGLAQGILTAGVKGGLDVLDNLIRSNETDPFKSPAEMIPVIQRVVTAMNKQAESLLSCFVMHVDFSTGAVNIASNGHSLPLIVRTTGNKTSIVHSFKEESSSATENGIQIRQAIMKKGDFVVAFSDGLANAKGLKSEIFERFMVRSLESGQVYQSANELVEDLKNIYNYYTTNKKQNDDVCFMAIKVDDDHSVKKTA